MKKVLLFSLILCIVVTGTLLAGCKKDRKAVINVNFMPGRAVEKIKQKTFHEKTVTRSASGVYIIKENTVTNQAGVTFGDNINPDIKLNEVGFDGENFKTRY